MNDKKIRTLRVRIPKKIVKNLDKVVEEGLFINRNEAIREAIREQIDEIKSERGG
jgi:metal-responsive CopG/Arc/MetJ family transcriptional regulator